MWVSLAVIAWRRDKPMWPWLVVSCLLLVIKRPGWTIEFAVVALGLIALATMDGYTSWGQAKGRPTRTLMGVALVVVLILFYGYQRFVNTITTRRPQLDTRPIACLGDSLTDFGYPQALEGMITVPIADFGVNGIRTDEGIKMIPEILAANPQLVVIELGGHDYNGDKKPREATKQNLTTLIRAFRDREIEVILVEIPRGFITDPYDAVERELAAEFDLQVIDDSLIRGLVFNSSVIPPGRWLPPSYRYSEDGLHPNELGNEYFAGRVRDALAKIYGDAICQ